MWVLGNETKFAKIQLLKIIFSVIPGNTQVQYLKIRGVRFSVLEKS